MEQSQGRADESRALPSCRRCGHLGTRHSIKEQGGLQRGSCQACDCIDYQPIGSIIPEYDPAKDPMNDPSSPQFLEQKLFPRVKEWAHSYDGYERFAAEHWSDLLQPLRAKAKEESEIPSWVGLDLLRAWAFFMARSHNWTCMSDSYLGCHDEIYAIAYAVQNHRAARKDDLPPLIPESFGKMANGA